jgi:hypothetical protein
MFTTQQEGGKRGGLGDTARYLEDAELDGAITTQSLLQVQTAR